ncbi:MAG TPA: methyltransferase [Gemmataceae bacterium]|jgi:hypothetical protein
MGSSRTPSQQPAREFAFLCVDDFLTGFVEAQALKSAIDLGLIDHLLENHPCTLDHLSRHLACDRRGLQFLVALLEANEVIENGVEGIALSSHFRRALEYRDLLETKLEFANLVAPDYLEHFSASLTDPRRFLKESRLFALFSYQHCFEPRPENYRRTKAWMRFTTCLTRYEAEVCLRYHDFSPYRRLLDVGGNSGEFVLRVCKAHSQIHGTVIDLPLVCDIGRDHVRPELEAERISFIKANALVDRLPTGFDVVTFKSMLHDWPEAEVRLLLTRASQTLSPGGTLLIFERGRLDVRPPLPYSLIPMLLFFRSFRHPSVYQEQLEGLGFTAVSTQHIHLDVPFFLITARLGRRASEAGPVA